MILIINICKEKLHYFEFVKPICDILDNNGMKYFVKGYKEVNGKDLDMADKVIICGTSLYDNDFMKNFSCFKWILNFDKPLLGICGGMQIIGKIFEGKVLKKTDENKNFLKKKIEENKDFLKKKIEIGLFIEKFNSEFLGLNGEVGVYHLHNYYVDFSKLKEFEVYCKNKIIQAVKHKEKEVYGVLFHPEVREKGLIKNFCSLFDERA